MAMGLLSRRSFLAILSQTTGLETSQRRHKALAAVSIVHISVSCICCPRAPLDVPRDARQSRTRPFQAVANLPGYSFFTQQHQFTPYPSACHTPLLQTWSAMDPDLLLAALDMGMEVASEVPESHNTTNNTTNNIATDKELSNATTRATCKGCNRQFATISAGGRLVPCSPEQRNCTSCEPFQELYETLQSREQEWTALMDRGPKHHGRVKAHWKYRNARVALENFLINVEAPDTTQAAFVIHADGVQTECEAELDGTSKHGEKNGHGLPTEVSPTTKRKLTQKSGGSNTERKRIKFPDTVAESLQYRIPLEYYRGAKEYVPGKYGAAEGSQFLDTSGSTLTFAKFTGQKKVRSGFVDIVEREV